MTDSGRWTRRPSLRTIAAGAAVALGALLVSACGEESTPSGNGTATGTATAGPDGQQDVTPYFRSTFLFDAEHFEAADALVAAGSPAAQSLAHARRSFLAFEAAEQDPAGSLELEIRPEGAGYDVCHVGAEWEECTQVSDLEFEDGELVSYQLDGSHDWIDRLAVYADGTTWIEDDDAMIELTSTSINSAGHPRLTLRYVSLGDDLTISREAPLAYRPNGFGDAVELPECEPQESVETDECVMTSRVVGEEDGSSDERTEFLVFLHVIPAEDTAFTLDDHIGIPLSGESSEGMAWIDLGRGFGEIVMEGSDDD